MQPPRTLVTNRHGRIWKGWEYPSSGATFDQLRRSHDGALTLADTLAKKRADLEESGKFTPDGVQEELKAWAREYVVPPVQNFRRHAIDAASQRVTEETDALRQKATAVDPSDVAAAIRRAQIRDTLRTMPSEERGLLLQSADSDTRAAVIESPGFVSGVTEGLRELAFKDAVEDGHGADLAELQELSGALDTARHSLANLEAILEEELGLRIEQPEPEQAD